MNNIGTDLSNLGSSIAEQFAKQVAYTSKELEKSIPMPLSELIYSDTQFQILKKYIIEFQNSLDDKHDVALMFTNFGTRVLMQVTAIGFEEPVLMIFKGFVDGRYSTLIQHVSQLNFLLTTVEKPVDTPKRKIGFTVSSEQ